jgi:hypothetical protein
MKGDQSFKCRKIFKERDKRNPVSNITHMGLLVLIFFFIAGVSQISSESLQLKVHFTTSLEMLLNIGVLLKNQLARIVQIYITNSFVTKKNKGIKPLGYEAIMKGVKFFTCKKKIH